MNSAANSGCAFWYAANLSFQADSNCAPLAVASHAALMSAGITNGSAVQFNAARVAAISSAPSAAPCTSCVPCLLGEPLPITVLQQMSVGLPFACTACALAAAIA